MSRSGPEGKPRAVPTWMQASIRERVRNLTNGDRDVLSFAALLGYRFDTPVLRVAVRCDQSVLVGALERMRDDGLIVEEPFERFDFRFRHALVRDVLIDEMPASMVRKRHAQILGALEAQVDVDRRIDELAYHALEAHVASKALQYSERAGDSATEMRALTEAIRYYGWALTVADDASRDRLMGKIAAVAELDWSTETPAPEV